MSEDTKEFLAALDASRPDSVTEMLRNKGLYVPTSATKTPRLADTAGIYTRAWHKNHTERKKRQKMQKRSRRINRQNKRRGR